VGKSAVYFDRDNTLIVCDGYLGDPAGVVLMPGAAEAVARARRLGYAVVTVSNQSGVGRGLFTEEAVRSVNARMDELLRKADPNAIIDRHEFCPFHPAASVPAYRHDSDLRKPRPGMLLKAREALKLSAGGWTIGDSPRDISAGKSAGTRTILFVPPGIASSPAARADVSDTPDFTATTLQQAMDIIEANTPSRTSSPPAPSVDTARVERQLDQILTELKRHSHARDEFSIARLLAGILQILVLAALAYAFLTHDTTNESRTVYVLLTTMVLQGAVTSLILMGGRRGR
jgi:D-glycero-D-manno-heptose 1,7-bisphosphate phosphatase